MKIKSLFFLIIISCYIISCNSRQDELVPIKVEDNFPLLMKLDSRLLNVSAPISLPDYNFYFQYDNQKKLTKKIGGFIPTSGSTGFGGIFSTQVYTSLIYQNNKVTVEDFSSSSTFTIDKKTKNFILNGSNQIIEKEIPAKNSVFWFKKQFFSYVNGNLDEIKTTLPNMPFDPTDPNDYLLTYSEKFFYDGSNNLVRTEYYEFRNGVKEGEKIIRTFGDFDNSYNPFKRFTLLEEYFYRSLSKNNFRTYQEEITDDYGSSNTSNQSWTFNYDSNGNIILN